MSEAEVKHRPKVTVLMSSYNHAPFLREAIDSVLDQRFNDFELIILDDGSTDGSRTLIEAYRDARIRAFFNECPRGAVANANHAITELARGDYIAIHHSDDAWMPDKLARQCALLDADPELGAVFTWVQVVDEHSQPIANDWFNCEGQTRWRLLNELFNEQNHLAHPSVLLRRACYARSGLYHPGLVQTPDADMWVRLLLDWPVAVIPEKLTLHRIHSDGRNASSSQRPEVHLRAANEWNQLRQHFLKITDANTVATIFPEVVPVAATAGKDSNVQFLLALACLHGTHKHGAWALGLEWLFALLNDVATRTMLMQHHGFGWRELAAITGQYDAYGHLDRQQLMQARERISALSNELESAHLAAREREATLLAEQATLLAEQANLQHHLDRIRQHTVYRLLSGTRRLLIKVGLIRNG